MIPGLPEGGVYGRFVGKEDVLHLLPSVLQNLQRLKAIEFGMIKRGVQDAAATWSCFLGFYSSEKDIYKRNKNSPSAACKTTVC